MKPLIRIDLERPDGFYDAGEVVRGTVTIKAPGRKCKGAFVTFEGCSRVHWRNCWGDDREYKAKTIFQGQCETLYATHFRTAVLEEAGKEARFDQVANSGIIRIPCDRSEEKHFPLVVRVTGRDRGTREIILGEVLVDVSKLVDSGTKEAFELEKNGRNKNKDASVTLSAEFLPYDAVYPTKSEAGVPVSSRFLKPLCLILRVHEAIGLPLAYLIQNDVCVRAYRLPEATSPGHMINLPEEEVIAPFAFQLRADAPGTSEFPELLVLSGKCSVRYTLRAQIYTTNWTDPSVESFVFVIPKPLLPKHRLWAPVRMESLDQPIYNCSYCCWYCCKLSGLISTKLHLERLVYAPGETIHLAGEVVNDSDKPLPFVVVLKQLVFMRNAGETRFQHCTLPAYFELFHATIPAQSSRLLQELEGIEHVEIPSVPPSFHGGVPKPHTATSFPCLKWSYTLEIRVGKSRDTAFGKNAVYCRVPILISRATRTNEEMQAAHNVPLTAVTDAFSFLDMYAVSDLEE